MNELGLPPTPHPNPSVPVRKLDAGAAGQAQEAARVDATARARAVLVATHISKGR